MLYVALMSFFVSAVCGYMAGLIGSSNSPLSGIGILVGDRRRAAPGVRRAARALPPAAGKALVAFALFVTAVVFAVAAIANNNLQDLKTGQLVDATPWKQQVALVIGVIAGARDHSADARPAATTPTASPARPGAHREHALPAPQAGLISALAQGVLQNNVDWSLIGIGAVHRRGRSSSSTSCCAARPSRRASARRWPWAWASTCRRRAR